MCRGSVGRSRSKCPANESEGLLMPTTDIKDHLEWVPPLSDPWGWDSEPYLLDGALDAPPELQGMEHELAWHDPAALGDAVPSLRPSTGSVQLPSQQVALQPYDQQVCQEEQLATLAVPPYQQELGMEPRRSCTTPPDTLLLTHKRKAPDSLELQSDVAARVKRAPVPAAQWPCPPRAEVLQLLGILHWYDTLRAAPSTTAAAIGVGVTTCQA